MPHEEKYFPKKLDDKQEEPIDAINPSFLRAAMRWYSLHPELPEKAVLRIRTAPNSSAAVCGRVSKGKAIAALAPEFEIDDDTLSLATSGSVGGAPQRWLHVSFPEELSGAPVEGYVMACLPNGMRLLVPWERAGKLVQYGKGIVCVTTETLTTRVCICRFHQLLSH